MSMRTWAVGLLTAALTAAVAPSVWAVAPSPSPTPEPPRIVRSVAVEDGRSTPSRWETGSGGFMGFPDAPSFKQVDAGNGDMVYYSYRTTTGYPSPENSQGACWQGKNDSSSFTIGPSPWPPTAMGDGCAYKGDLTRTNCILSINNGRSILDPLANFSYGSRWQQYRYNHYLHRWGHYDDYWSDGRVTRGGNWDTGDVYQSTSEYRVEWGACQFYSAPREVTKKCLVEISDMAWEGPVESVGLPARNTSKPGEYLPGTEYVSGTKNGPGPTALGKVYLKNGAGLKGYGDNAESLALVDNCAGERWKFDKPLELPGWGNYKFAKDQTEVTCKIVEYPGWGKRNFRGCTNETTRTDTWYAIKRCSKPIVWSATADRFTNFDPSECTQAICSPNIDIGEGLQNTMVAQDKTTQDIPTNRAPTDNKVSVVSANGLPIQVNVPDFTMTKKDEFGASATPLPMKWAAWQVKEGSSPWAFGGTTNANSKSQPFGGMVLGERNMALWTGKGLPKDELPNVDGWSTGTRTLSLSFYRPGNSGEGLFETRASFMRQFNQNFTLASVNEANLDGFFGGPTRTVTLATVGTCTIPWQDFKVVQGRNVGGLRGDRR